MIKQRKKIAAMLVASMILVTSLPNTAEAFRLQHRRLGSSTGKEP